MPTSLRRDEPLSFPLRVALGYATLSVVWILVWDELALAVPIDGRVLGPLRRTAYIGVTAFFLWWLTRREVRRITGMKARFDAIADQSVVGVYIARGNRLIYVNDSLTRMLGFTEEVLLSRPATDFLDPSEIEKARVEGLGPENAEPRRVLARRSDGRSIAVDVVRRHVELEDGPAFAGIVLDAARAAIPEVSSGVHGRRDRGRKNAAPVSAVGASAQAAATQRAGWRAGHTVLVVDDEPAVRRVIAAALRRQGYRVVEAGEGSGALQQLQDEQAPIDLVICDFLLPGGTGLDLVRRLMERRPDLRVLFVTGYNLGDLVEQQPDLARFPFIEKPFSVEELTESVDRMWEAASA